MKHGNSVTTEGGFSNPRVPSFALVFDFAQG